MTRPDPHEFLHSAEWLEAWRAWRAATDPNFSIRAFARQVGEADATILHGVVRGRRRLTLDRALRWLPALGLSTSEARWLILLVRREDARADLENRRARSRGTAEDTRQIGLAEETLAELNTRLATPPRPEASARAGMVLANVGLPGGADHQVARLVASQAERVGRLANVGGHAVYGLTEAVGPEHLEAIRAELDRARVELLEPRTGAARHHVQLLMFPVSRRLGTNDTELTVGPRLPAASGSPDTPTSGDLPPLAPWTQAEVVEGVRGWLAACVEVLQRDPRWSHAAFARKAEQQDRAILWKVIRGTQRLTPARARQFAGALEIDGADVELFVRLAARDAARPAARRLIQEEIDTLRAQIGANLLRHTRAPSDWVPYAVHELALCPGFDPHPDWIVAALDGRIDTARARTTLSELIRSELFQQLPAGVQAAAQDWVLELPAGARDPHHTVLRYHHDFAALGERVLRERLETADTNRDPAMAGLWVELSGPDQPRHGLELLAPIYERLKGVCGTTQPRDRVVQLVLHAWLAESG